MIEARNISAGYGEKSVLDGFFASFEKGRLTSIIGANGSGKSTLLKVILGILPVVRGEILLDGVDSSELGRTDIARRISYLPQGRAVPDMTVEQLVLHGRFPYLSYPRRYRAEDREIARAAMDTVGILQFSDSPLHTLSGGMRQNAYIAMALAQDTDYILLDEPTTYLDISHQLELMRMLRTLADGGKGIVTVMHDLPMAFDFSDNILAIDSGKVAAAAEPSTVYNSPVVREIFGVELERSADGKYHYKY